jgi:hypothetical protein
MTLTDRLTEVRERLLLSGDYGPGWSATCDATVCQEALDRIRELAAALRRIAASHGASDHACFRRDLADQALTPLETLGVKSE